MISALSAWVRAIVGVGVLVAFIEMMAPRGALRKSVDMVLALVVVAAIAGPIIELGAAILPTVGGGYTASAGSAATAAAGVTAAAMADGLALCMTSGLASAYPGVSSGWVISVTPAWRGSAMRASVDTRGWAGDDEARAQVRTVAAACAGLDVGSITVR